MKQVLIVGGYGEIGRRVAAHLLERPDFVVALAGRNRQKVETLAAQLGPQVTPLVLDVNDAGSVREALKSQPLVVNCVDLRELHLVSEAIRQGLTLVDATASHTYWEQVLALKPQAEQHGARVLLGAGLIPGITNVMARAAKDALGEVTNISTGTLLSLLDSHGEAALDWTLDEAGQTYSFPGTVRPERSFVRHRDVCFGGDVGCRKAYRFSFPSQFHYQRTLEVTEASSWMTLEPSWVATLLSSTI